MHEASGKLKFWFVAAAAFAICIAPTFISYQPYVFRWDDSGYLQASIAVNRAFWSSTAHGVAHLRQIAAALQDFRPPAMRLMGLPWGPLTSWDAAGKCFLTLAVAISFVATSCLFLMVRMGVKPLFLVLASICAFASLGPLPPGSTTNHLATAFMADSLFAWITLAALLLIPYESRTYSLSLRHVFLRGALWGLVLSSGAMTKISFLYFVSLILASLLAIRLRHSGPRSALVALAGFACSSAPATIYLLRYGRAAFENGEQSSFGSVAGFYDVSFLRFLDDTLRHSPGLAVLLAFLAAMLGYLAIKGRAFIRDPELLGLLIVSGFGVIVLASVNREIRFSFPVILSLPFLCALLLSGKGNWLPRKFAALIAVLVFCSLTLAAFPVRLRAERQASLARSDAVLAEAGKCGDRDILLATDSPNLNELLLNVSAEVTSPAPSIEIHSVDYSAMDGVPIEEDFHAIQNSDQVVFQDDSALSPPFTNQRVADYRTYIREQSGYVPAKVWGDVIVYSKHCRP
jgi:hypothetical protein